MWSSCHANLSRWPRHRKAPAAVATLWATPEEKGQILYTGNLENAKTSRASLLRRRVVRWWLAQKLIVAWTLGWVDIGTRTIVPLLETPHTVVPGGSDGGK
jgi:hypothetical protein